MKEYKTIWSKSFKDLDFFEKVMLTLVINLAVPVIIGLWCLVSIGLFDILSYYF